MEKSHTCGEGEAQLRICFWHLLMNFEKSENQNFEKMKKKKKKITGDINILNMCTKNYNHMKYSS